MQPTLVLDSKTKKYVLVAAGAGASTLLATQQAEAAVPADVTSAVTDITATMAALGGLAISALAVVLVPFGISYALKFGKRVMAKG